MDFTLSIAQVGPSGGGGVHMCTAYVRACMHTYVHRDTYACMQTDMQTRIPTYTHAYIHMYMWIHI